MGARTHAEGDEPYNAGAAPSNDAVHVIRTPIVVTLVHGTFAKGAPWTKEGSILRREIAATLGEHERDVVFDTFDWSGSNTHKARVKAGYQLADHIRELRQRFPVCKHFIIAHSHGGNVALLAHKHLPQAFHAKGVATLGTPFIYAKLRDDLVGVSDATLRVDRQEGFILNMLGWMTGLILGIMTAFAVFSLTEPWGTWGVVAAIAVGWIVWSVAATWLSKAIAFATFPLSARRAAIRLGKALELKPMPRTAVLSFIYPGDEAGWLLGALQQTSALPNRVVDWFKEVGAPVAGVAFFIVFVVGIFNAPITDLTGIDPKTYDDWALYFIFLIIVSAGSAWVLLVVARYMLSVLRGHPAGFGWERPSIHAHVDIGINSVADVCAKSNAHQEVPFSASDDARGGLRHSGLYEDRRILKALAYWMAHVK